MATTVKQLRTSMNITKDHILSQRELLNSFITDQPMLGGWHISLCRGLLNALDTYDAAVDHIIKNITMPKTKGPKDDEA